MDWRQVINTLLSNLTFKWSIDRNLEKLHRDV